MADATLSFVDCRPCRICHSRPRVGQDPEMDADQRFYAMCPGDRGHEIMAMGATEHGCVAVWNAAAADE